MVHAYSASQRWVTVSNVLQSFRQRATSLFAFAGLLLTCCNLTANDHASLQRVPNGLRLCRFVSLQELWSQFRVCNKLFRLVVETCCKQSSSLQCKPNLNSSKHTFAVVETKIYAIICNFRLIVKLLQTFHEQSCKLAETIWASLQERFKFAM